MDTHAAFIFRMPVTKNSFRQYRVLGKGGFGLVSVGRECGREEVWDGGR